MEGLSLHATGITSSCLSTAAAASTAVVSTGLVGCSGSGEFVSDNNAGDSWHSTSTMSADDLSGNVATWCRTNAIVRNTEPRLASMEVRIRWTSSASGSQNLAAAAKSRAVGRTSGLGPLFSV